MGPAPVDAAENHGCPESVESPAGELAYNLEAFPFKRLFQSFVEVMDKPKSP